MPTRNHVTNYWKKFRISHSFATDKRHDRHGAFDVSWLPMACDRMSGEHTPRYRYKESLHRCIGVELHLIHRYNRTSAPCRIIISISRVTWEYRTYTHIAVYESIIWKKNLVALIGILIENQNFLVEFITNCDNQNFDRYDQNSDWYIWSESLGSSIFNRNFSQYRSLRFKCET